MNSKNKADLQRRLSMAQIPKPPAGLGERIKNEIPNPLVVDVEAERQRLSRSVGVNLRIAASILFLVSSSYLCLQVLWRTGGNELPSMVARPHIANADRGATATFATATQPAAPAVPSGLFSAPQRSIVAPPPVRIASATSSPASFPASFPAPIDDQRERTAKDERADERAPLTIPAPVPPPAPVVAEQGSADTLSFAPQPEDLAKKQASTTFAQAPQEEPVAATAAKPSATRSAANEAAAGATFSGSIAARSDRRQPAIGFATADAAELFMSAPRSLFGVAMDERPFMQVKEAIERGEQPSASSVDIAALVNYFAGSASRPPRDLRFEVEASPAPVAHEEQVAMLRFTIDTPVVVLLQGGSIPPIATDINVDVEMDPRSVVSQRRIGGNNAALHEPVLMANVSVTALYEIQLQPRITSRQHVATVRLHYRTVADGKTHTIERSLRGSDFAHTWQSASRRHRLASLGAVWGQTLRTAAIGADVARRAEELATQEPRDSKARELADLAGATSRLRSSSSTGNGR